MDTQIRQHPRTAVERRVAYRRIFTYEFGSPEWLEHVQKSYAAWPREDRRKKIRRDGERRKNPISAQSAVNYSSHIHQDYTCDLLSQEEKLFFDNLFSKKK